MKELTIKLILISGLALGFCTVVQAQGKIQDVLHLKNGSIIRGQIQENSDPNKVSIITADQSLWVFEKTEIKKTTSEKKPTLVPTAEGYYGVFDLGLYNGRDQWSSRLYPALHLVNGYQFNEKVAAGIGVGIETYGNMGYAPLFAEGRYFLLHKKTTPFLAGRAGWALPIGNQFVDGEPVYRGGLLLGGVIGFRRYLKQNFGFQVAAGYSHQQTKQTSNWWWPDSKSISYSRYHNFEVRIGILFR